MGASNQTYSFLPDASSSGTSTPQSRSRVIDRGCRPDLSHERHCPYTLGFSTSFLPSSSHFSSHGWYLSSGRYQCLVSRSTGGFPLNVEIGLIRSVGLSDVPHFSHWSP